MTVYRPIFNRLIESLDRVFMDEPYYLCMQPRLLYSIFLGLLIMTMATVSISTFLPAPEYPEEGMASKDIEPPQPPKTPNFSLSEDIMMPSDKSGTPAPTTVPLTGEKAEKLKKNQKDEAEKMQKRWERYNKQQEEYVLQVQEAELNAEEAYANAYDMYVEYTLLLHIGVAVLLMLLGLIVLRSFPGLGDGVVLGGIMLLVYHLGKSLWEGGYAGFEIQYSPLAVIGIAGAVILTSIVGYIRYSRNQVK